MTQEIMIYGAGGFAREVAWLANSCNQDSQKYRVVCFIDDKKQLHGKLVNDVPVLSLEQAIRKFPGANIVNAMGIPRTRESVVRKEGIAGFKFETLIHPRVERSKWIEIGEVSVICAGSILATNILIGRHVQINLDCTIGHDVILDDFTTLAPGVHVSGWVHFGKRVYVGTGAVVINGTQEKPLTIGDDAVIGAGACVTRPIPAGETWGGVPARSLHRQ